MRRIVSFIILGIMMISLVSAIGLTTRYNPWTGKLDYIANGNFSDVDIKAIMGNFSGNLSVESLEVRSGQSIILAGAKFSNLGFLTDIDTNLGISNVHSKTTFLNVHQQNTSADAFTVLGLSNANWSRSGLMKNSANHTERPNQLQMYTDAGSMSLMVPCGEDITFGHFDGINVSEQGEIVDLINYHPIVTFGDENNSHLFA